MNWGLISSSEESTIYTLDSLSLNQFEELSFSIYPNPASNTINLQLKNSDLMDYSTIHILDVNGRIVLNTLFSNEINVQQLDNGVYFIKISGLSKTVKFIKK